MSCFTVEHHARDKVQRAALHIFLEDDGIVLIGQIHGVKLLLLSIGVFIRAFHNSENPLVNDLALAVCCNMTVYHVLSVVAEEHILGNDV